MALKKKVSRGLSSKSLGSVEPEADCAAEFLMSSAQLRLKKAMATGSSSESSLETEGEALEDLVQIFGLVPKDLQRGEKQQRLEDLTARQLAVSLANVSRCLQASDFFDVGGSAESLLAQKARRTKRLKDKDGENDALNQASAAGLRWKKRMGHVCQLSRLAIDSTVFVCGKPPSAIQITNAKSTPAVTAILRSLAKSHKRKSKLDSEEFEAAIEKQMKVFKEETAVETTVKGRGCI
ncbi:unnamed protein product [Symbiodinium sp. CCMP2456]|nr:unnamed protein product [Symbiodinium sp. CCMP2456]